MKRLITIGFILLGVLVYGQVPGYRIDTMIVSGDVINIVEWVPTGANSSTKTIMFTTGRDEARDYGVGIHGPDGIPPYTVAEKMGQHTRLFVHGPAIYMSNGSLRPANIRIIAVQPKASCMNATVYDGLVEAVRQRYSMGNNKISLTGLSCGAYSIFEYINTIPGAKAKVASIVPMSFAFHGSISNYASIPVWAISGNNDAGRGQSLQAFINNLTNAGYPNNKMTMFSGGHCCWNNYYNPNYREGGKSVYEWLITPANTPAPPTTGAPISNAGSNQTITLPTNSVTLNGSGSSDPGGSITSYLWRRVSGPNTYNLTTANSVSTSATGLVAGTYQFSLLVTDNSSLSDLDTVQITVNPAVPVDPGTCVANAGPDKTIELDDTTHTVYLNGLASTGINVNYNWYKAIPPKGDPLAQTYNIKHSNTATPEVLMPSFSSVAGQKIYLTVTNDSGCTSTDSMMIFVNRGTPPPQATNGNGWRLVTPADIGTWAFMALGDIIIDGANDVVINGSKYNIYLHNTDQIALAPNRGIWVRAGRYGAITTHFQDSTFFGSSAAGNRNFMYTYGGQVEWMGEWKVSNLRNVHWSGAYVPGVRGHVNYQGFAGGYANRHGKFGFYANNRWQNLNQHGVLLAGAFTDSVEMDNFEAANGYFSGFFIKAEDLALTSTNDYDFFKVHHNFLHDLSSEGIYALSTSGDTIYVKGVNGQDSAVINWQHQGNGWDIHDNLIVRTGSEGIQFNNQGLGNSIHNNVVINAGFKFMTPFGPFNDRGFQMAYRNGGNRFQYNIVQGATQFFANGSARDIIVAPNGDTNHVDYNFLGDIHGSRGGSHSSRLPNEKISITGNFFKNMQWTNDRVYNSNATEGKNDNIVFKTDNTFRAIFKNNKSDGSKSILVTAANLDSSGNQNGIPVAYPKYVNSGWGDNYNFNNNSWWADLIYATYKDESPTPGIAPKWLQPWSYSLNEVAFYFGKFYRSKIFNNTGNVPKGYTDANWELLTWNEGGVRRLHPPDDYRLRDDDTYKALGFGFTTSGPPTNTNPISNAGTDSTITLPRNTVSVKGDGSLDPDGSIVSYVWSKITAGAHTIINPSSQITTVSGFTAGAYQLKLVVTDNQGATDDDTVTITVNPAPNIPPTANAGSDQEFDLPVSEMTLNGSGTDIDGTISTYAWSKITAGPHTITATASATTTVTGFTAGEYQIKLTVTDNSGATAVDTITVIVNAAPPVNIQPISNAGSDQSIYYPPNSSVTLSGGGTDSDGTIVTYQWTKISGTGGTFGNANSASTTFSGLTPGTYQLNLRVKDDDDAIDDDVVVIVVTANATPIVSAGPDLQINTPSTSTVLTGSANDEDGTILTYLWSKLTGGAVTITTPALSATGLTGLIPGTYQFELMVTDNRGAIAKDTVTVLVNSSPTVEFEGAATQFIEGDSIIVSIKANDDDGNIVSILHTKLSGNGSIIRFPTQGGTVIAGLQPASSYTFQVTVTDDRGATATDTVIIIVNPNQIIGDKMRGRFRN